jgi:hypothetical protein
MQAVSCIVGSANFALLDFSSTIQAVKTVDCCV